VTAPNSSSADLPDLELFRVAMQSAGVGFCLVSPEGQFLEVNPALCQLLGRSSEALRQATLQELTHPDDLASDLELVEAVKASARQGYRLRKRFLRPDGSVIWGDLNVGCVRHSDGRVRLFVSQIVDVSEAVAAQAALAERERQLRASLDALLEPHILLAPIRNAAGHIVDFRFHEANPAACAYNGVPRERLIGMTVLELLPAHQATGLLAHYAEAMESGQPLVLDDMVYQHDVLGGDRRYDIRAVRVGELLSYSWRDVTERHRTAQRLAASERRFRLLAENATDVVVHMRDGRIVWVSPSVTTVLGWQPDDWIGQLGSDFLEPADHNSYTANLELLARGRPVAARNRIRAKSGSWHWMDTRVSVFLDEQGRPDGILAAGRLVDAEVAAKQAMERKSAELASKLRTSLTAAVVAHEINQPLSVILLQAQLALDAARRIGAAADPLQAALASLIAEGDQVVATLRSSMRMLLRNVETPLEPLDLALVVNNAVLYVQTRASQQAVELRWQPPPQPLPVAGDAVQLQRAIANLIRNSLEALAQPAAASAGRIVLSATRLADGVELRVADNGPGFGDLQLEDLPLTTSKHQGMGLGLFVVQTTITNHGGTMALGRSALGGAEVLLRLPLLKL
jgi:PAS domain S-box-containing protein